MPNRSHLLMDLIPTVYLRQPSCCWYPLGALVLQTMEQGETVPVIALLAIAEMLVPPLLNELHCREAFLRPVIDQLMFLNRFRISNCTTTHWFLLLCEEHQESRKPYHGTSAVKDPGATPTRGTFDSRVLRLMSPYVGRWGTGRIYWVQ